VQEGVSQPAMTQLITRLQDAGLARKEADPDDGRVVRVHITDTGRAELRHRRAVRTTRLAALLERLPVGQQEALSAALPAVVELTRLTQERSRA
jgi:DNA-binding MarR family transcriptional regulator